MLFDEIRQSLGIGDISGEYRATLLGEKSLYVEGVKSIKSFTKTEIILFVNKGVLKVIGEELEIKKYCAGDVSVCGKIKSLEKI